MANVNIYEAKTQLSRLVDRARAGEEIVIARAGTPLVRLVPVEMDRTPRMLGVWQGRMGIEPDWDSPEVNAEVGRLVDESLGS